MAGTRPVPNTLGSKGIPTQLGADIKPRRVAPDPEISGPTLDVINHVEGFVISGQALGTNGAVLK